MLVKTFHDHLMASNCTQGDSTITTHTQEDSTITGRFNHHREIQPSQGDSTITGRFNHHREIQPSPHTHRKIQPITTHTQEDSTITGRFNHHREIQPSGGDATITTQSGHAWHHRNSHKTSTMMIVNVHYLLRIIRANLHINASIKALGTQHRSHCEQLARENWENLPHMRSGSVPSCMHTFTMATLLAGTFVLP